MNPVDTLNEKGDKATCWTTCTACSGHAIKRRRLRKKVKLHYQRALDLYHETKTGDAPIKPKGALEPCPDCNATGLHSI